MFQAIEIKNHMLRKAQVTKNLESLELYLRQAKVTVEQKHEIIKKKMRVIAEPVEVIQYHLFKYINPPIKTEKTAFDPIEASLALRMKHGSYQIRLSKEEANIGHQVNEELF